MGGPSFTFTTVSLCEIKKENRDFLRSRHDQCEGNQCEGNQPMHLFMDILSWLPQDVMDAVLELQDTVEKPYDQQRDLIMACTLKTKAAHMLMCVMICS